MSYITFGVNDVVYIKNIGYATLLHCGNRNSLSQKIESGPQKKESIIFDPDLFNSDGDSNHSKKSQAKSDDEKTERKLVQVIEQKKEDGGKEKIAQGGVKRQVEECVNIVKARLEGTSSMLFTCEKNVTKSITVMVRCMGINQCQRMAIDIEINRNVDTLKKMIFQQLGESINNYSNIKMFAMLPVMTELLTHSKTMIQYQIKDMGKIVLTAQYSFGFKTLPPQVRSKYAIAITNHNTLTSNQHPTTPTPPTPPTPSNSKPEQAAREKKEVVDKKQQQVIKQQVPNKMLKAESEVESFKLEEGAYIAKCPVEFHSGRRYWEIKVEKLPAQQDDLLVGICVDSDIKEAETCCWGCDYAWAYQPISGKKVSFERDWEANVLEEESQSYGYAIRQNDAIGLLLTFRGRKAHLTFYKNGISCGQAFMIDLEVLKSQRKQLIPFVGIGGQSQVILDSKAMQPLDSFRLR